MNSNNKPNNTHQKVSGIVRLPKRELTEKESAELLQALEERKRDMNYATGGRFGNTRIPFDLEEEQENNTNEQ